MAKEGSTVSGLVNSFAQAISIGLQHGVPVRVFCEKFSFTRFEPSEWTGNLAIPQATSVMDYIFRFVEKKFLCTETIIVDEPGLLSSPCAVSHNHTNPPVPNSEREHVLSKASRVINRAQEF